MKISKIIELQTCVLLPMDLLELQMPSSFSCHYYFVASAWITNVSIWDFLWSCQCAIWGGRSSCVATNDGNVMAALAGTGGRWGIKCMEIALGKMEPWRWVLLQKCCSKFTGNCWQKKTLCPRKVLDMWEKLEIDKTASIHRRVGKSIRNYVRVYYFIPYSVVICEAINKDICCIFSED